MKKILFVCIAMMVINQNIFSQDIEENVEKKAEKKWTIQTSPFLLFSDIFVGDADEMMFIMDLEGQCKLSNYVNISITLSFLYHDRTTNLYDYDPISDQSYSYEYIESYFQVGFKPMFVLRPNGTGLKGFFLGIYPNLGFRYNIIGDDNTLYTEAGFGLNLGYKWVFESGFTMQVGGGMGRTFSFPPKSSPDIFINSDGRISIGRSDFSIDLKLGYSF